ncbi:uncharacterized protein RJT21DRAFT_132876 [Scheffersomyces amazonensis]|uniref:uncharacterized protein n=1 Tax=Scheffersomyces amazonensis TaxID=1078765 RepID=UPI00315D714D
MVCSVLQKLQDFMVGPCTTKEVTCLNSSASLPEIASSLESLPDEILSQIIDHLNQLDVVDLSLVNSRLYSLCMNKLYKRKLYFVPRGRTIIHRKLNTFTHTNFTIVNDCTFPQRGNFKESVIIWTIDYLQSNIDIYNKLEGLDQMTFEKFSLLHLRLNREPSYDFVDQIKKMANKLGHIRNVELLLDEPNIRAIHDLQGIFTGVRCLALRIYTKEQFPLHSILPLFCPEKIQEIQIDTDRCLHENLINLIKLFPNIETLIVNSISPVLSNESLEPLSNTRLQKFSLFVDHEYAITMVDYYIGLVKDLLNQCGSTLQLVRFGMYPTTFLEVDLFCGPKKIDYKEVKQDIRNLVYWVKERLHEYPRLSYFTFYNYSFFIDRQVEPCEWIEISGWEL